ncbi:hypothetical protein J4E06_04880 [Muricauda sp. NFXS6]|uniref:KAP family P-loop NTPase fold protein n=1 Tax=Allomuricauda sp. NFXS6 TaxID=2819094 RepID=UPI0032DF296A
MKINFIPDEVLKLTEKNDLLGTKPYSDTIFEIVNNCDGSKNIGLFGSWGSGKSTILSTLENRISNHNGLKSDKIGYFEFDAWKYSKDDFRRSFLIELTKKFNVKTQSKLERLLYAESTVEDPKQTKHRFNWLSLPDWLLFLFVVFAFLIFIIPMFGIEDRTRAVIALITISVSLLSKASSSTINKYKVVIKENKVVEPERFETIFDEIISDITGNTGGIVYNWIQTLLNRPVFKKVVIVIDNLDRCDDENLLLTLNTIKNFLEHEKVIFILPVDEKGISSFLAQKTDNADEYLRKIFHLILRLKAFSNKELTEFTSAINDKYKLGLNSACIRIICQEFTNNPRKVIQFLNNYQSEMWLVTEQANKGYINGDVIKDNLSFFIKLLIIKYEWKDLYDHILYDKRLLSKINEVITNLQPDENGLYFIANSKVKLTDSQRNFLFSTQEIRFKKLDPFILNIDLDKEIPDDIDNFIRLGKYQSLMEYLNDSDTTFDEEKLIKKINEVYSEMTFKHQAYEFIALPVLQLLIEFVLDEKQGQFRQIIVEDHNEHPFFKSLFKDVRIQKLFPKLDFNKIVDGTKWFYDNVNQDLYNSFLIYFKSVFLVNNEIDDENEKIEYFISKFKDTSELSSIQKNFSNKLIFNPSGVSKIKSLENYKIASQVISKRAYKRLARELENKESKGRHLTSKLCLDYSISNEKDKASRVSLVSYYLDVLELFYKAESISLSKYEHYLQHFLRLNELLNMTLDIKISSSTIEVLDILNDYLYTNYKKDFDESKLYQLYSSFFDLIKNLIFYTEEFNQISYRTSFFTRYLKKNISRKLSLKINDILSEDVAKYDVYDYPFSQTLLEHFKSTGKDGFPFGNTLLKMFEKTNDDSGLTAQEVDSVIDASINAFAKYPSKESKKFMFQLKKSSGQYFLNRLNGIKGMLLISYVKNVKSLEDKWFYGKTVLNYLKKPFEDNNGRDYPTFRGRLSVISKKFNEEEQCHFILELIDYFDDSKMYKWLRYSYQVMPKKVYDVFLERLISAHKTDLVGHNDFFEWVVVIPLRQFSKRRKREYVDYITGLNINHKTYKPKRDKALRYLT